MDIVPTPFEVPDKPTIVSHSRTGENITKIWVWATLPLILHFASVLTLVAVVTTYINGHDFNLQSRYALSKATPLQSDITTAISSGITISRLFAAMWSAATLWRCIFILMGKGGISLEQIDRLLTWQIHMPPHLKSSQHFGLLVSIILLAAFPSQFSGPILTGSITWSSSHRLTEGQRATDIPSRSLGDLSHSYSDISDRPMYIQGCAFASAFASTAWRDSLEDERTMKRVIRNIGHLPINSTLKNVTLPYFAITKLEWTRETTKVLPPMLDNSSDVNPLNYYLGPGTFTIIPDAWGGAIRPSHYTGIISETRPIVGIFKDDLFGDKPSNIGCFHIGSPRHCMIFGHVSYVAGAAECRDCRVSSWITVQNDTDLTVVPSEETLYAISMMPLVGAMLTMQNISLPTQPFNNLDGYITALLIRSYAGSWIYNRQWGPASRISLLSAGVQIAIPTSRANISLWRVWLWLSLNLLFTVSGLLFLFMQMVSGQQLLGCPPLAVLLLDTTEVYHKRDRAFCNFSTLAKDDKDIGYLRFRPNSAQEGHRQVEIVEK